SLWFCGILYHSITLCFVSIDKHDVQGVIHAGFMYHSCVTLVSIETENRYCSESSGKRIYMYL
ncbi:MAG: hypothetical protein KBF16_07890, partial [Parabacteroides sp.]|nr:hypothetical protein [Parabacteroides sp.]